MKLVKRHISILAMIAMLVRTLGGCSSPKDTVDKAVEGVAETVSPTKVVVWNMTLRDKEAQKVIIKDFSSQHDDIQLEFKELPEGTAGEIAQKLITELAGGSEIDIFDVNQAEYFKMAEKGLYEPLSTYIEQSKFDVGLLGKGNIDISLISDELYGLPYIQSKFLLYYNKNLFDQAGVAYPTNDWTWNDFKQAAKQLTSGEGVEKIWGATMPWYASTWTGIASQQGVKMVEGTKANFDNPAYKEALQFKYDLTMVDKSSPSLAENKMTKAHFTNEFSSGKTAMLVGPEWAIGNIGRNLNNEYPFEYDLAYIPHPEGVEPGTTYGAPRYIGINGKASKEKKEASWKVLQYLATSEVAAKAISDNGAAPSLMSDLIVEYHLKNVPEFVANAKIIFEDNPRVEEKASHVKSNQIEQILKEEGELALSGTKSVEETIKTIQQRVTEELSKE